MANLEQHSILLQQNMLYVKTAGKNPCSLIARNFLAIVKINGVLLYGTVPTLSHRTHLPKYLVVHSVLSLSIAHTAP